MSCVLWIYGIGMVLTGALWAWGTRQATRNPDAAKRRAGEHAYQWRYFVLVLTTWPVTLAWMIREAIRVAREDRHA